MWVKNVIHVNEQAHNSQWVKRERVWNCKTQQKKITSKSFCLCFPSDTQSFIRKLTLLLCSLSFRWMLTNILRNLISFGKFISHVYSIFFIFMECQAFSITLWFILWPTLTLVSKVDFLLLYLLLIHSFYTYKMRQNRTTMSRVGKNVWNKINFYVFLRVSKTCDFLIYFRVVIRVCFFSYSFIAEVDAYAMISWWQ